MTRTVASLACLVLACLGAAPALAQEQQTVAPPGNSGVAEHLETVPAAGGDQPADGAGPAAPVESRSANAPSAPREVLGARTAAALNRLGVDGRAAAKVAAAGVPDRCPQLQARQGAGPGWLRASGRDRREASGGRADAVASALTGGGGIGLAFPLLLLGTIAASVGLVAIRRISRRG